MKRTFNIVVGWGAGFRKWDLIQAQSDGGTAIVIRTQEQPTHQVVLTVFPYKNPSNRFLRYLKFLWLRIRVYLKIIK